MQDYTKQHFLPWMLTLLLGVVLTATLWHGHERFRLQQHTIDSLRAVHQQTREQLTDAKRIANSRTEGLSGAERREVLWATRAVLSETKNPREMLLIANVIRNRVDMKYRGKQTAKQVILDPLQFSAFNPGRGSRWRYANLSQDDIPDRLWHAAWQASRYAMTAPRLLLPVTDQCVTHFVHPRNLREHPEWISRLEQLRLGEVQRPNLALFRQNRDLRSAQC
jgi:hypothetical protein